MEKIHKKYLENLSVIKKDIYDYLSAEKKCLLCFNLNYWLYDTEYNKSDCKLINVEDFLNLKASFISSYNEISDKKISLEKERKDLVKLQNKAIEVKEYKKIEANIYKLDRAIYEINSTLNRLKFKTKEKNVLKNMLSGKDDLYFVFHVINDDVDITKEFFVLIENNSINNLLTSSNESEKAFAKAFSYYIHNK